MNWLVVFFVVFQVVFFYGCSRGSDGDIKGNKSLVCATNSNSVLIRCGEHDLTLGDFNRLVDLRKKIMLLSLPAQIKGSADQLEMVESSMWKSVTNRFAREVVLDVYAKTNNVTASTNDVARCKSGFIASCKMNGRKWEEVLSQFSAEEQKTILERVKVESLQLAVKRHYLDAHPVVVDDAEIATIKRRFSDYNRRCAETNKVIWAMASNIWHEVEKGESFKSLAEKYDQDETRSPSGEWGEFTYSDFNDEPELAKASRLFRPDYVTPPIEGDNGLMIVRVDAVNDDLEDPLMAGYKPSPTARFTLSRIFLHLPEFIEPIDDSVFRDQVWVAKSNAAFERFVREEVGKTIVEFPLGTVLFDRGGR